MRTIKKTVACLVAVLMVLGACSAAFTASATAYGTCGDNATWSIDNGVLTIGGSGAMDNYAPPGDNTPWALSGQSYSSIVIESGITHIGEWAFGNSPATSVSIPNTVTTIGSAAFSGSGLTSVTIPGSVTSWQEAFVLCTSLTSATIESGVELIDVMSFGGCSNLTSVTIPTSVTTIGQAAFHRCSNLTSITLPQNLTTIDPTALAETGLTEVSIPDSVTSIGSEAFCGCTALESVNMPTSVQSIDEYAFDGCSSLTDVYYAGTQQQWDAITVETCNDPLVNAVIHFAGSSTPSNTCGENVTWSIENNVLTISGTGAMYDYGEMPYFAPEWTGESFTSVVIGSGVTHIGAGVFSGCTSLTSVTISNTVTSIGEAAFCGCNSLANLTFGSGLVSIGRLAFSDCDGLTSLTIPDSVTTLGDYAFQQCSNLATLTIGTGVTNLGYGTFQECVALTTINYNAVNVSDPSSSPYLFVGMPDASTHVTVNVGSGVQRIPAYLFWIYMPGYGPNIETVNIPSSVTAIGASAFYNCTTITDVNYGGTQQQWNAITIGSNNDPLLNATIHCAVDYTCGDNLTWSIENGVLTISGTGDMYDYDNGYAGEPDLPGWVNETFSSVVISSGVTSIGDFAFEDSPALTSVSIPASVASIGRSAFNSCNMLNAVYITDLAAWCGISFYNAASNPLMYANSLYLNGTHVSNLVIPNTVERIEDNAFNSCALQSVTIPDSVTYIGAYSFICSSLRSVNIPSSVTEIGDSAFRFCTALTELEYDAVNLPDFDSDANVFSGAGVYFDGFTVTFGESVQRIPANLFYISDWTENPEFVEDNLPNVITVNIGSNVESIGNSAFYGCTTITDVYYNGTQQQWNAITIGSNNDPLTNATLHCTASPEEPQDTYSLSVGDQVSVNLILDLNTRGLTVSDVSVTMDGQDVDTTVTNDGDQYRFTIITAPAQIADEIVITVGDETITTTVMDYCIALCGHEYDEYEKEQNLAKAILHYGKAANDWFDWTDETITTFGELNHQPVQAYTGAIFTDGTHKITGASFMALAKPVFRFYMSGVSEADAAAFNQANNITAAYSEAQSRDELHARFLKATRDGETIVLVEVTGISAENMDEEVIVNIPGLGQFTFNGNAFAKAMANDSDPVTQNFGAALYNYGVAANTCFKPAAQEDQP